MKKILAMLLILSMLMGCSFAMAEDLGVQMIGGPGTQMETLSLDDIKLGSSYRIEGYADFKPLAFSFVDCFAQYQKDQAGNNSSQFMSYVKNHHEVVACDSKDTGYYYPNMHWNDSGSNAQFAWFTFDIVNRQKQDVFYMKDISVKVVYADEYEFAGWVRQFNHDYDTNIHRYLQDEVFSTQQVIDPANEEAIGMMYTGSFVIGCTLPNVVVEGKEPLRMEIKIGDNELTYNIRK